jgi:hypothetical protein
LIILDTDIVSFLDRGNGKGFENLARRFIAVPDDERVCVTIISFEEQMRGWLAILQTSSEYHISALKIGPFNSL